MNPVYKRVIVKFTGEMFKRDGDSINEDAAAIVAKEIKSIHDLGVEIAVVLGGGNIVRGRSFASAKYIKPATSDYMGMLATVQNGLALEDVLAEHKMEPRLMSALEIKHVAEPYIRKRAIRHLEKGRVVIQVGGSGRPNFTTDATAVLLAVDIRAEAILKATKVEGIYDKDPFSFSDAEFFPDITADEMKKRHLEVIEESALTLNKYKIPIHVFNIFKELNLQKVLLGEKIGSQIIF